MIDLDKLRDAVRTAAAGLPVAAAWLFGSEAAGKARPESDVDIAILPIADLGSEQMLDVQAGLSDKIGRDVHLIDLRRASPILGTEVVRRGVLLFEVMPVVRALYVASLPSRRFDLLRVRRDAERALLRRMGVGQ